jgi:hypothetical protein
MEAWNHQPFDEDDAVGDCGGGEIDADADDAGQWGSYDLSDLGGIGPSPSASWTSPPPSPPLLPDHPDDDEGPVPPLSPPPILQHDPWLLPHHPPPAAHEDDVLDAGAEEGQVDSAVEEEAVADLAYRLVGRTSWWYCMDKRVKVGTIPGLRPTDVVFGRGNGPNRHPGNAFLRSLVSEDRNDYLRQGATPTDRKIIVERIVRYIKNRNPPGRFLRLDPSTGRWEEADAASVWRKVEDALRKRVRPDEEREEDHEVLLDGGGTGATVTAAAEAGGGGGDFQPRDQDYLAGQGGKVLNRFRGFVPTKRCREAASPPLSNVTFPAPFRQWVTVIGETNP